MATIEDLPVRDFSKMTDEELLEAIKEIRSLRRSPDPAVKAACRKKAESKQRRGKAMALQKVDNILEGVTPEMAKALLAQLKGGN